MKRQVLIYGTAIGILDVAVILAFIYGTITDFTTMSFAIALFLPFVAYMFLENYMCSRFELKQIVFAACVMGFSLLSILLILFLTALITRSFSVLEGVGWAGMFVLYAYVCMVGLRLLWQLIQKIRFT